MERIREIRIDSGFGLVDAFRVAKGDVVSLVGAGGKTTVLYALSMELRRRGFSVVTTCTTHMQLPASGTAPPLVVVEEEGNWLATVKARLAHYGSVTVIENRSREDKLRGLDPVMIDPLRSLADCVVIEADGARGRSLKAPADHEPVLAAETTLTVVIVGLDALGEPLHERFVHRVEVVKRLAKAPPASEVTNEVIAAAVVGGYLPKLPRGGRWLTFLNKASDDRLKAAEKLGEALLRRGAPEVVFGEAIRPHECFYRMTVGSGREPHEERGEQ
ncbi:MAG TPA: selenium cofactor biosynthesis protein YqeC [Vicinamibacteria bacterium]|nr:selenium cofactor biosynthesis protein YqeC [Vicinamibacteria bacterium]